MDDAVMDTRKALREEILSQVADERRLAWTLEKELDAKLKTKRLDHEREDPDPVAPWANMAPEKPMPPPGVGEALQCEFRNEVGDAELFERMYRGCLVLDYSVGKYGQWQEYNGVVWKPDYTAHALRLAMTELPAAYEAAAQKLYTELKDERAKAEKRRMELDQELEQAKAAEDDERIAAIQGDIKEAEKAFKVIEGDKNKKYGKLKERVRALRGNTRASSVLKVAAAGKEGFHLGLSGKNCWEKHPNLFAVANGVVDLETGRLIRSAPQLYLQKSSPYPYIGLTAHSDWFEDHLRKVFCGNETLISYFEWAVGYSVTGVRFNKDIYVAYGPKAANGKSATFNAIKDAIGEYATTIKVDVLLADDKSSKGPDPDLMAVDGIRMGIASEAGDKARFSVERIKAITGGDDIRARGMYADSTIIDSMVKLWLHTNDVPNFSGYDPGFHLRLKVLPFEALFTENADEVDEASHVYAALPQNVVKELSRQAAPYILSWIFRCARKFYERPHMRPPDIVLRYTKDYFKDQDTVGRFIEECCSQGKDLKEQAGPLHNAFQVYCTEVLGMLEKNVVGHKMFGKDMAKRFGKHQSNVAYYHGLELLPDWRVKAEARARSKSRSRDGGGRNQDDSV